MSIINALRKYLSILSFGLMVCLFLVTYTNRNSLNLELRSLFTGVQYLSLSYLVIGLGALLLFKIKKKTRSLSPFFTRAKIFASLIFFCAITGGLMQRDHRMVRTQSVESMKCWANKLIEECEIHKGCPEPDVAIKLKELNCMTSARICGMEYVKSQDEVNFRILAKCHMYGIMFLDRMGRTKEELNFTAEKELRERVLTDLKELPVSF